MLNIVFEAGVRRKPSYLILDKLMGSLSKELGIKTEILTGDITTHERLTIPLKDGKNLIIHTSDCDSNWVGVEKQ